MKKKTKKQREREWNKVAKKKNNSSPELQNSDNTVYVDEAPCIPIGRTNDDNFTHLETLHGNLINYQMN